MTRQSLLLTRWYAGRHLDQSEFWDIGMTSLGWFAQEMRTDPARWQRRDLASRAPLVVQRVRQYV